MNALIFRKRSHFFQEVSSKRAADASVLHLHHSFFYVANFMLSEEGGINVDASDIIYNRGNPSKPMVGGKDVL